MENFSFFTLGKRMSDKVTCKNAASFIIFPYAFMPRVRAV
jgi:hypothetical protein